ncbi:hypothetical protein, partial [Stenotrophomonas maltophilia]|uniref:hypothetical protein n=1 Tax=Stenotrophomonas maltophilia TaxID=40324 RepID=UPI001954DC58
EGGHAEAETRRDCGIAEEVEGEGIVVRHWRSPSVGRARPSAGVAEATGGTALRRLGGAGR